MCGRFAFYSPAEATAALFGVAEMPQLKPRYNIAPTQDIAAIRINAEESREVALLRWGLIPFWVGVMRGLLVGMLVTVVALFFTKLDVAHPFITLSIVILSSTVFALAGFINAATLFCLFSTIPMNNSSHC